MLETAAPPRTLSPLATRVGAGPLIEPSDVRPSLPGFEVVAVLNPAAARVDDEFVLLLRVAERASDHGSLPADALTLDLGGAHPLLRPLASGHRPDDVVPIALLDPRRADPAVVVAYLPRDLPGLDTGDPRAVSLPHPVLGRRLVYLTQMSHLRVARSRDGINFRIDDAPAIAPASALEEYGCEDARATLIGDTWYITYVSVSRLGITTSLATTRDFRTFSREGAMTLPDHKDVALFPEQLGGRFLALMRPMPSSFDHVLGMWIAVPDSRLPWGRYKPLVMPRHGRWDERHTGASTVPFRVPGGWLEIYHGVDGDGRYALGAVLLDGCDPSSVLRRSPEPILVPELPFETHGFLPNVVYSCGHVALNDPSQIRVYYGAADRCVGAADFSVKDIIDSLEPV
ncbi:MAG: glycosidase [Chloroflexota bacterium]|nr:glycosidase [Chloroflexota bacterium]